MLAKQGWDLVRGSKKVYEQWKRLPDAERERTRASAERVGALSAELSKALAVSRFRRTGPPGGRGIEAIAGELQVALTDLATGPLGGVAMDAMRPKRRTTRAALKVGQFAAGRIGRRVGTRLLTAGASADPVAARVETLLHALRAQHREHERTGVGLTNIPAHQQVIDELVGMGSAAVPPLIERLDAPRPGTDTPEGLIEEGVANDVAGVLGAIGDPDAIDVLVAQFERYVVAAPRALAQFPEGVETLIAGLDAEDEFVRSCCIQGLGFARGERARAAEGLVAALGDAVPRNREQAALSARLLAHPDQRLLAVLDQVSVDDPSERVRMKAEQAGRELMTQLRAEV